jgi:hypothetical protein
MSYLQIIESKTSVIDHFDEQQDDNQAFDSVTFSASLFPQLAPIKQM